MRGRSTLLGLEAIAHHLAGVPGRKNLIWLSAAFPSIVIGDRETVTFTEEMTRATRAINDADIAIYPVDARGLIGTFTSSSGGRPALTPFARVRSGIETMQELAGRTGGQAFYNTNDIGGAIRRAVDDSLVSYVLGFYPDHGKWDGHFNEIKLRVNRPGLEVRHRKGYYAHAMPAIEIGDPEQAMRNVVRSPLESTGIRVSVRLNRDSPEAKDASLNIFVDPKALALKRDGDRWNGAVDLYVSLRLPAGAYTTLLYQTITIRLTDPMHDDLMARGLLLDRPVAMRPDALDMRIVVRDRSAGTTGSVVIPLPTTRQ